MDPVFPEASPHREGQFLVPRAWLSPGLFSAAVGRRVAPVACVHSRKRPDPKGAGLPAARRVALEMETRDSTGAVSFSNYQSSSLHRMPSQIPERDYPAHSLWDTYLQRGQFPRLLLAPGRRRGGARGGSPTLALQLLPGQQLVEHRRAGEW